VKGHKGKGERDKGKEMDEERRRKEQRGRDKVPYLFTNFSPEGDDGQHTNVHGCESDYRKAFSHKYRYHPEPLYEQVA